MAKLSILFDMGHIHVIGNALPGTGSGFVGFRGAKKSLVRRILVFKCVLYGTDIAKVAAHNHALP